MESTHKSCDQCERMMWWKMVAILLLSAGHAGWFFVWLSDFRVLPRDVKLEVIDLRTEMNTRFDTLLDRQQSILGGQAEFRAKSTIEGMGP